MSEKKSPKKKSYRKPEIKVVTYNPRDKVMTGVYCDAGSGTDEFGNCDTLACELP